MLKLDFIKTTNIKIDEKRQVKDLTRANGLRKSTQVVHYTLHVHALILNSICKLKHHIYLK